MWNGMPLGTAPFLSCHDWYRPNVISQNTRNIACVGQSVEIIDDTTLTMEYSVRSAQNAVSELMGLLQKPEKIKKSLLLGNELSTKYAGIGIYTIVTCHINGVHQLRNYLS